jgi:glutathione-regulated potassium-efflux system ancillary protein KefG
MRNLLHILVHPTYEKSRANRILVNHLPLSNTVTQHDLYECYPAFDIDIQKEKSLLLSHDIVLIQHPLYWYSCPPLLKHWIDLVLELGWAYGEGGTALKGKTWVQAITTGGDEKAYSGQGFHKHELNQFLLPFKRTAELCHMKYLEPFTLKGTFKLNESQLTSEGVRFEKFVNELIEEGQNG